MELVVISGKGGTGKTTIAIALSELVNNVIKADCDVDAPNLYLMYKGEDIESKGFVTGKKAVVNQELCIKCGKCDTVCKYDAIKKGVITEYKCEGCGACTYVCPTNAIKLEDAVDAKTIITKTDKGFISRAEMEIGADGSGKLITEIRKNAKKYATNGELFDDEPLIIIDGSPGIGCAVISSISNTDAALIVTEPTKSGLEDLKRILSVCKHFNVLPLVCVNKHDINDEVTNEILEYCSKNGIDVVGKIPYDNTVMKAINELKPITEFKESKAYSAILDMWGEISKILYKQ
ncbi:electron transport complex subunit RsxB [Clostridium tepidiprofundi DSM 19306]|uniref:Electron transport complex subunit RsxB n=1 Tax=Clostridium tepidiprofundi DSM 19306 TaxID=1121338 RepID=A0A151B335_9CLOT|nr:ATP-binding protein [Clostridium tepidiprofundi]KYH34306.1 electron transport complex subunit RsxB [Clostridium tepidiprofundi DSM 19306]